MVENESELCVSILTIGEGSNTVYDKSMLRILLIIALKNVMP